RYAGLHVFGVVSQEPMMLRDPPWALIVVALLDSLPCRAAQPPVPPKEIDFFESKVRPVLADQCFRCHSGEKHKGGLRLDSRAADGSGRPRSRLGSQSSRCVHPRGTGSKGPAAEPARL